MTTETLSPIQQEMLNRADAIFNAIGKTVDATVEFGKEQIPDIAYQYLTFERVYISVIFVLFLGTLLLGLWLVVNVAFRNTLNIATDGSGFSDLRFFSGLCGLCVSILGVSGVLGNMRTLFMVWFAPKIYLIQSMVDIIKTTH
jgi:hypothetical protein